MITPLLVFGGAYLCYEGTEKVLSTMSVRLLQGWWWAVSLPDEISAVYAAHTNNIRAEIEQAAKLFDVDMQMMKACLLT